MRTSISTICVFPQFALLLLATSPLMGQTSPIGGGNSSIQGQVFDENDGVSGDEVCCGESHGASF